MKALRMEIFCAWGDGPDVGINMHDKSGELIGGVDMTAAEARTVAAALVVCAEGAERMDREYAEYVRQKQEADEDAGQSG